LLKSEDTNDDGQLNVSEVITLEVKTLMSFSAFWRHFKNAFFNSENVKVTSRDILVDRLKQHDAAER